MSEPRDYRDTWIHGDSEVEGYWLSSREMKGSTREMVEALRSGNGTQEVTMEQTVHLLGERLEKNAHERKELIQQLYAIEEQASKTREIVSKLLTDYDGPQTKGQGHGL